MLKATSNGALSKALDQRISELKTTPKATLTGPEWFKFIEYGTTGPYIIRPVNAKALRIPDAGGRLAKLGHDESGFAFAQQVTHPGISPKAPLRKILFSVRDSVRQIFRQSVASVGVTSASLRASLLTCMESVKALLIESISTEVPGSDSEGRLQGKTAAEDFAEKAQIHIEG